MFPCFFFVVWYVLLSSIQKIVEPATVIYDWVDVIEYVGSPWLLQLSSL